jgi:Holliday junction resolvasome RuvABC endonuclease subunit
MDSIDYAKQVLQEHLLTNTYKQLSETEATTRMIELKDALKNLISTHSHNLSKVELTYFQRSL